MGTGYRDILRKDIDNLPTLARQKEIAWAQLGLVLGRTPESEKGGRLGHYLDIIDGKPTMLKDLPDVKEENLANLIVVIPFSNKHLNDDWKTRMAKVKSFLEEKGITHHYFKNGSKDAILIDTSNGDNVKTIEELYEASEKTLEEKSRTRDSGGYIGR